MKYILLLIFPFLLYGCIEAYDFEVGGVDKTIVVDAELTETLSYQQIKLSYQNQLDDQQFNGVSNAGVIVEDSQGNEIQFIEIAAGVYEAFFGADREKTYRLRIDEDKGGKIMSDFEGLPPPVQIDSLVFEELKESFVNEDSKNKTINVVKAYGVSSFSSNENDLFIHFGNIETVFLFGERKKVTFPPPKSCFVYNMDVVPELGVFEIKAESQDVEIKSLFFTKPINWQFGTVLSVKADMISMNGTYYEYWKEIEEVYTQDGNINNLSPARIGSNLTVENHPPVIGFFAMTSISSDVIFIRRTDLKTFIILRCGTIGGPFLFPDECNNCLLLEGSTTNRPDYW